MHSPFLGIVNHSLKLMQLKERRAWRFVIACFQFVVNHFE